MSTRTDYLRSSLQARSNRAMSTTVDDDDEQTCKKCKTINTSDSKYCRICGAGLGNDKTGNGAHRSAFGESQFQAAVTSLSKNLGISKAEVLRLNDAGKLESYTKRHAAALESKLSGEPDLSMFSSRELEVLGLIPTSLATIEFEGQKLLSLPSPSEAAAMLKGNR